MCVALALSGNSLGSSLNSQYNALGMPCGPSIVTAVHSAAFLTVSLFLLKSVYGSCAVI